MTLSPKIVRLLRSPRLYLIAAGLAVLFAMRPVSAAADAEVYVQTLIDQGMAILKEDDAAARRTKFHAFVLRNVDAQKTALFALGRYRRGANQADLGAYVDAFREYATAVYEMRLEERKDDTLKVTGSRENKPGDVTVEAETGAQKSGEPVKIAFRLLGKGGQYKVVDVQAAGVWLSIEQRDQFATILGKNGGDIGKLTQHLIAQTKEVRSRPADAA